MLFNLDFLVTDREGEVLVGANVVVSNTLLGVITNGDGVFELGLDAKKSYSKGVSIVEVIGISN